MHINTYLSIPENHHPMIIDAISVNNSGSQDPALTIGSINPIHCSASGKICAAFHPKEGLQEYLNATPFNKMTDFTITSRKKFTELLPKIRENKIALTINERGESVIAAASPVFNSDGKLAGIIGAILPQKDNYTDNEIEKYANAIRETAEAASFSLGFAEYNK